MHEADGWRLEYDVREFVRIAEEQEGERPHERPFAKTTRNVQCPGNRGPILPVVHAAQDVLLED